MVLDNFLHHRQPKAGSILLAMANERLKQLASNQLWNATAGVTYSNLDRVPHRMAGDCSTSHRQF